MVSVARSPTRPLWKDLRRQKGHYYTSLSGGAGMCSHRGGGNPGLLHWKREANTVGPELGSAGLWLGSQRRGAEVGAVGAWSWGGPPPSFNTVEEIRVCVGWETSANHPERLSRRGRRA